MIYRSTKITRRMIPLILAWAVTIHKVQGLTMDQAVIELDCFDHHMEYVALSRLKTLNGLGISVLNINRFVFNKMVYQPVYDQIYSRNIIRRLK